MRLTIVVFDNIVIIDGKGQRVDCSGLAADNIHALQWYGDYGEIEFEPVNGKQEPHQTITDLEPFQPYLDAWAAEGAKQALLTAPPTGFEPLSKTTAQILGV